MTSRPSQAYGLVDTLRLPSECVCVCVSAWSQGQWLAGVYHGQGRYVWPDGRSYEGEWQHNKMHGTGTYIDINGHR